MELVRNISRQNVFTAIKIIIVVCATWYLVFKIIKSKSQFDLVYNTLENNIKILFLLLTLMVVNWTVETYKWKCLLKGLCEFSFFDNLKAVTVGVACGIFTPFRIGESAGKVYYHQRENHADVFTRSVSGSITQLLATIVFGLAGGIIYFTHFDLNQTVFKAVLLFLLFVISSILIFVFRKYIIEIIRTKINVLIRFPGRKILLQSVFLSALRYVIFSIQFLLCLNLFGINAPVHIMWSAVALSFLVTSIIPGFALSDLVVRGSVAVFFCMAFTDNPAAVLSASFLVWIINIAIPAMFGLGFLIKRRSE